MSGKVELIGEARSRLRMAREWLWSWSRLSARRRQREPISDQDIAELAIAQFQVDGATACAESLRAWTPRTVSFRAGRIVARRFVDHARYHDLDALAVAAGDDLWLVLAVALELQKVHRLPPFDVIKRAVRLILSSKSKLGEPARWRQDETVLAAATALVEAAHRLSVCDSERLAQILTRHLPDHPPRSISSELEGSRFTLLRAYTLRAALRHEALVLNDLAHPELRRKMERGGQSDSQEEREFRAGVGALLPWHRLWADVLLGRTVSEAVSAAIVNAESVSAKARGMGYRQDWHVPNEIAQIWLDVLVGAGVTDAASMDELNRWIDSRERPLFTPTLTYLARLAARTESLRRYAAEYATRTFHIMDGEREDAQMKAEVYIDLARAVLPANLSEAKEYFDEAIEVAGKIGDENLVRWTAMLDLADRAGDREMPHTETAYKLARCSELTREYVVQDKYFDWRGTVRAIAGLCASSSLTILSRWRDRKFGWSEELLPEAISFLLKRGDLDPKTVLPLIGFRVRWDPVELLKFALAACITKTEKETSARFAVRYMTLHGYSGRTWRALKDLLTAHELAVPGIDELVAFSERTDGPAHTGRAAEEDALPPRNGSRSNWDVVFEGIDLVTVDGVSLAYNRFRSGPPPLYSEVFFAEACRRVPVGREADFIRTLPGLKDFTLYQLRYLLEQLPGEWRNQLSVKRALVDALRAFCRAFCLEIARDRNYEVFPFELASELCGFTQVDVADQVLSALGEGTEPLHAHRLFTLVGLLALKLSRKEALEALAFGLDLFDDVLEEKDGDGPWSARLAPPSDIEAAVAGYVWAGLAAPWASQRWEAAHVVRGLCALGRENAVGHLLTLAKGSAGGPFADAGLHFYDMHARQWLLIALARAAKDHPRILAPHADFLIDVALNRAPHVLIRGFAARAALELLKSGVLQKDSDPERRLANVNVSPLPAIPSKNYAPRPRSGEAEDEGSEDHSFYFGLDMGTSWFAPLGRCFSLSGKRVEKAAKRVIQGQWQYAGKNRWDEDERHKRKLFRDFETSDSRYDPRTHDLQFYRSYHAVMVVAGELLASYPTHQDPEDAWNDFDRWLADSGLSRPDGGWLADRRDPAPLEWPAWRNEKPDSDWRWSISRSDFDSLLVLPDQRMNVWGDWTAVSEGREESISVRSALASPGRSDALLRALQSAEPFRRVLPAADDGDSEIVDAGFQLKGWVTEWDGSSGLDKHDPWAGNIDYPPHAPAQFVVSLMGIGSDPEHRQWVVPGDPQKGVVMWSQIWGNYREKENEDGRENGRRLQASLSFVVEFLRETQMDLIVKVQIQRWHTRYADGESDEFKYPEPSERFFLFRPDGGLNTI